MNVQDVVTRVRRTFGDEAAVQVSNDDIIRWINDGQVEIVRKNENALQTTALMNLVAEQAEYTMPADLLLLRSLKYKFTSMQSFSSLKYVNMQQLDEIADGWDGSVFSSTNPAFYTLYDNVVTLFPRPSEASANGLKILYNQKPTDVTTLLDNLALPLIYHTALVKYCLWQASLLDEDFEPGMMHQGNFSSDLAEVMSKENNDPSETYPVITVREFDM